MENKLETRKGIIVCLKKNYGFIKDDDGEDIFFHSKGTINPTYKELREGNEVEYLTVQEKNNRKKAIGVVVI